MKKVKFFLPLLGVTVLLACGSVSEASKTNLSSEQDKTEIVEKDSVTLAKERNEEQARIDRIWMENDQSKIGDLFESLRMSEIQINRFVVEARNNERAWKEDNPDEIMTLPQRRALRDKTMHNILNPSQMNEYLMWTQKIDEK